MNTDLKVEKIRIKNMIGTSCIKLIQQIFLKSGIKYKSIYVGEAEVYNLTDKSFSYLKTLLQQEGFDIIEDPEKRIVEQIKLAVIELVHYMNNVDSIIRKSEYLVEKLNMSYQQISKIFSKHEPITLEKYIIYNKIERIKELINSEDFTLSEISFMMDYSSVQYLSNQFKAITNLTVSEYKKSDNKFRIPVDKIIEHYSSLPNN